MRNQRLNSFPVPHRGQRLIMPRQSIRPSDGSSREGLALWSLMLTILPFRRV
jgi:hypothetical protein